MKRSTQRRGVAFRAACLVLVPIPLIVVMARAVAEPIRPPLLTVPLSKIPGEPEDEVIRPAGAIAPLRPTLPVLPPIPAPSAESPAIPQIPQVSVPLPSSQPEKPAETPRPVRPILPDSDLRPMVPERTVKEENREVHEPIVPTLPITKPEILPAPGLPRLEPTEPVLPGMTTPPEPTPSSAPGDFAMKLPPRSLSFAAVLGTLFLGADLLPQSRAEELPLKIDLKKDEPKKEEIKKEELEALRKQVDELKVQLNQVDKKSISTENFVLGRADAKAAADKGLVSRVYDLEATLKSIDERLRKIEDKLGTMNSTTALRPTQMPSVMAKIRLINEYPMEMTMLVNGKAYRVEAGETKFVDVNAGTYTYELLHTGSKETSSPIKEGETVTLRIR